MINRLLFWRTALLRCRLIDLSGKPYLERYFVGQLFGVTFYLHRFVSSDTERHVHNHPWRHGASIILAGSYIEEKVVDLCPPAGPSGAILERTYRRWFNRVNCNTFHRISNAPAGTWTLFFHGPRMRTETTGHQKGWGFLESAHLVTGEHVTVFTPYKSRGSHWWLKAKLGKDIGRVPL